MNSTKAEVASMAGVITTTALWTILALRGPDERVHDGWRSSRATPLRREATAVLCAVAASRRRGLAADLDLHSSSFAATRPST
jgi:hypothetical protein